MAVSYISYEVEDVGGNRSGSFGITVPASASLIVVIGASYTSSGSPFANPVCSIGENGFTQVVQASGSPSYNYVCLEYAKTSVVGTGAKTLSYDVGFSVGYSINFFTIVYLSGTTDTGTVLGYGGGQNADDVTGLSTAAGCMIVGGVGSDASPTVTGDSQSSVHVTQCAGDIYIGVAYEANEGDWYSSDTTYPGVVAAVFAAGGASSTPTLKRRLNILLRLCLSMFNLIWRCFK